MNPFSRKQSTSSTVIHGSGDIGGKGEGLLLVDHLELGAPRTLQTHVITSEVYDRYRDNNDEFDQESRELLGQIHEAFDRVPIGVRASETLENDPLVPTSGVSTSFMLPNCHKSPEVRFAQLRQAIKHIYDRFSARKEAQPDQRTTVAVLVNPIPGVASDTRAGKIYHPMSSGVADSLFRYPLTLDDGLQDPEEGFARVAFGHGYAVVLDQFEVIPVATIRKPLPPAVMTRGGQQLFYALGLDQEQTDIKDEMSTMSMLSVRFAAPKILAPFQDEKGRVNFDRLIRENAYDYHRDFVNMMEQVHNIDSSFQIEFTWNLVDGKGVFHIVQFKSLRGVDLSRIEIPAFDDRAMVSTDQFQGHGVTRDIRHSIVINPFAYAKEQHDEVVRELRRLNAELTEKGQRYILVCPGRVGTTNREWGFNVDYPSVSGSAVIVEYGYDIHGSPSVSVTADEMTGGIYGSHFLYQILGGAEEAERARRARIFGSQGTHFLTNLYTSQTLYLLVNPARNHLADWFFIPPEGKEQAPIYLKRFEQTVTAYADLFQRKCMIAADERVRPLVAPAAGQKTKRPMIRIINPHKIRKAFVLATNSAIRGAAARLNNHLPYCNVEVLSGPKAWNKKLADKTFVLFLDEGAIPFYVRSEFKRRNPQGTVVLLSYDLQAGSAPTREEVERVCPLSRQADIVFYVNDGDCAPSKVMPAAVRYVEDLHNIEYHSKARRFIFLVVDDELRWFSQFLPVLYRVIGQRAGVITARTFEEARAIMDIHGSDVVCVITDMLFPKGGVVTAEAGRELVITTKIERPRIPIIVASKADRGVELQDIALILPKGDPGAVEILDRYIHDFSGLGDFLFFQNGRLWRRASTLEELRDAIAAAPIGLLEEYAENDYFSTWLYMHGFKNLADRLVVREDRGKELKDVLLSTFEQEVIRVKEQELVLLNGKKEVAGRARTIDQLQDLVRRVDERVLKEHSANDVFSMWLMRKGYPELADRIRPIHGDGEELREALVAAFDEWSREHEG